MPRSRRCSAAASQCGRAAATTEHDVDFYLREVDAERGLAALAAAGTRGSPARGWLFKAHNDEVVVDLIFRPSGGPIADDHFDRAEQLEVMAQPMLVASLDDVLVTAPVPARAGSTSARCSSSRGPFASRSTGTSFGRGRADRRSHVPSSRWSRSSGSRRRSLRLRGPLQGCRTKPVEPPTVRQPQYVPPKHDLHRHAVLLPHTARLAPLAARERLAHHGQLDVHAVLE